MTAAIQLPGTAIGPLVVPAPGWAASYPPPFPGGCYAAAHVAAVDAGTIDWEATLRFREHLWAHGFGVAEAMDTAQRGMGLSWDLARELIARSAQSRSQSICPAGSRSADGVAALACGAGTDQLADGESYPIPRIIDAYAEQLGVRAVGRGGRDRDGEPGAGGQRPGAWRLPRGLRFAAAAGRPAGDPALAGRGVRPGAARLLGQRRVRRRRGGGARA